MIIPNLFSFPSDNEIDRQKAIYCIWSLLAKHGKDILLLSRERSVRLKELRQRRADRIARIHLAKRLAWFDCDGHVNVIVSGMDCDCTKYAHKRTAPSDLDAYIRWEEDQYEWADGPMSIRIVSDEEAATFEGYSRDLALEAYEDGHPHVVYA